jgi:hypothetical protein
MQVVVAVLLDKFFQVGILFQIYFQPTVLFAFSDSWVLCVQANAKLGEEEMNGEWTRVWGCGSYSPIFIAQYLGLFCAAADFLCVCSQEEHPLDFILKDVAGKVRSPHWFQEFQW